MYQQADMSGVTTSERIRCLDMAGRLFGRAADEPKIAQTSEEVQKLVDSLQPDEIVEVPEYLVEPEERLQQFQSGRSGEST